MQTRNSVVQLIVAMLAFVAVVVGARPVEAVVVHWKSGMVSLTPGQTLRVNVVNVGEDVGYIVHYKFFDSEGALLDEFRLPAPLPPGHAAFFDFVEVRERRQVRTVVTLNASSTSSVLIRGVRISVEVINNATGRSTILFVSDPDDFVGSR